MIVVILVAILWVLSLFLAYSKGCADSYVDAVRILDNEGEPDE